jgi:hypothetical protein
MHPVDTILMEYSGLADEETAAGQLCPACQGGPDSLKTLSVTNKGGVLVWYCHRASCGFKGRSASKWGFTPTERTKMPALRGIVGRTYVRNAVALPDAIKQQLQDKWCITDQHIAKWGLGWDYKERKVVLPTLTLAGDNTGCVLRVMDDRQPKAKTHTEDGVMSWYASRASKAIIIVEDIFSAIRAADYMTSVALLSTHLNDERITSIKAAKLSPVYLALDKDAYAKSIKYTTEFRSRLRLQPLSLDKDLKDHTKEELDEFFNRLT